jgi:beta-glucosidase
MAEEKLNSKFPKTFMWGASTAAHQIEGNTHNQWTVWELENAKAKAAQAEYRFGDYESWDRIKKYAKDPDNYVSGNLADHHSRYQEDFDLLQKLHMNTYRFGVEWSRIEPQEGVFDPEAIEHYKKYVAELDERGIEPIVTLFHFTLPIWFVEKGGFEKRSNVKYFTRFAKKIVTALGPSIKYIITINEPEVYAAASYHHLDWPPMEHNFFKAMRVINNLAYAHKRTSRLIHGLSMHYRVSISKNSCYFYPGDDAWLSRVGTMFLQYMQDDHIIKKFIRHCDFLGVNYYLSNRVYGYRVHNPDKNLSDLQWDMQPGDIQYVLERLYRKYKLPILITENGLADSRDIYRKWWITQTIIGMQNAMKYGVKLIGYLHWSLIDNFEWAYGKWPRFGLAGINYATGERKLRPSAIWFGQIIKKIRGL